MSVDGSSEWLRMASLGNSGRADRLKALSPSPWTRPFETIFIGRLERWKGPEWLIKAMARACKPVNCRLKIVGDLQGERQHLAERISHLRIESRVEFFGWQSQERCAELLSKSCIGSTERI